MYAILELKSNIRVPPELFEKDLTEAVKEAIIDEFVGELTKDGLFLSVVNIKDIGDGKMIPGDGAVYYETTFEILTYQPILQEVIEGEVSEITEFGVFVRMGPIDGLAHISQVMDDYVNYANGTILGKQSKRVLKVGDVVRARVIAVSMKSLKRAKIGLTMRQPGLGKLEWLESEKDKEEATNEKKSKTKKSKKKKK